MKFIKRLFILAIILGCCFVGYQFFIKNKNSVVKVSVVHHIDKYGYDLYSNSTELFKNNFYELEKVLKNESIDENEYASLVAKLFIIDFYTLDNKTSNLDIGGIQFVHSKIIDNFKLKAKDTMYKYVKSNIYGDRKQDLPVVDNIEVDNISVKTLKKNDFTDDKAFYVEVSWSYKKDLGFDTQKNIVLIHEGDKLSLISID